MKIERKPTSPTVVTIDCTPAQLLPGDYVLGPGLVVDVHPVGKWVVTVFQGEASVPRAVLHAKNSIIQYRSVERTVDTPEDVVITLSEEEARRLASASYIYEKGAGPKRLHEHLEAVGATPHLDERGLLRVEMKHDLEDHGWLS